jgi:hypothetical protein
MSMLGRVRAFFDDPRVNFWGAVLSVVAEVGGWLTNVPDTSPFSRIAFALTVFFLGRLAWTQYWEAHEQRENRKPKFDLVFRQGSSNDDRPFFQTLDFKMAMANGKTMRMNDRRFRVGLVNLSSATIPNVRVVLESCTPSANMIHVGHRLLRMDSDPEGGEGDLPPSPDLKPTLFFDVVNEMGQAESPTAPSKFLFCYAIPGVRGHVGCGEYEIVLRAEGGDFSCTRTFLIKKDALGPGQFGPLIMKPL